MSDKMIDKDTLNMLSSEMLIEMKMQLKRVIKEIDSILDGRDEK
jgi:hypothetical protein